MTTELTAPAAAAALQTFLDGEHARIRDWVRELLARPSLAPAVDLDIDTYRDRVLEQAHELAAEGGTGLGFPEEFGGGGDVGGSIASFETLAFGDLSLLVKCGVQFGLFGGAVLHLGTRHHHDELLADIVRLELPGCFAMTESGHGSDVQSLLTTATYDPGREEFVVHTPDERARKDYIGNAARHGRMAVVFAQLHTLGTAHGVHAFLVPIRTEDGQPCPGVAIEDCGHKIGLNGVDNGRLWFDEVRVPRTALLDRFGHVEPDGTYRSPIENRNRRFFTMLGTLVQGRVSVGGAAISATKTALVIAVRYALERRQFRAPRGGDEILLLDYRAHQRRLLPALATTYAHHFAQRAVVADLHRADTQADFDERDRRQLESRAAGLKAATTAHATATIQTCREACGGAGYLSVNRLGQLKADTDVFTTFEGDNTVLLQLVAKGLLTDYRDQFSDLDLLGTAMFVADQVVGAVVERTAARQLVQSLLDAVPGREEDIDVLHRGYHLELFCWREEHVLEGVARRLRAGINDGHDPFEVLNECQDHVLLAARAHIDRLVLEAFIGAVDECEDPELGQLLGRVCDLYALANLEADRGWFLEHGRITSTRSKAIIRAVNEACDDLRPHARVLVDAFGVPDAAVGAPIGLGREIF